MKNFTTFFARAAMLLLLAVFTTTPAQATDYISDVLVVGTKNAPSSQPTGWTRINQELNAGAGGHWIYLYYQKVSNPTSSSQVITDFILVKGQKNVTPSSNITHGGRTYSLADYEGDNGFDGDLNKGASGDYIYLYYTRQHSDDFTAVTNISFNTTQSGAVGNTDTPTTGYNLNAGAGGDAIYMHLEKAKTPVFLSEVTSNYTAQNGDILTGTLGSNVKISIASNATVTLRNATINRNDNNASRQWAGITCEGSATINLEGTNKVTGFYNSPGIQVPYSCTLAINGSGSLEATGRDNAAGIGAGGGSGAFGYVTIDGGTITARGGSNAAGIGSGYYANGWASCDGVTITGGTVTAIGGSNAAGIGGGYTSGSHCSFVTINGGTVTATGGSNAAGIGGGNGSNCGNITISTGVTSVTATKGSSAPNSIGAGKTGTCGTVSIGGLETGSIVQSPVTYKPSENFKYTVAYNSNGGSGSMATQQFLKGFAQNLRANTFTYYAGHNFLRWNTKSDGTGTSYTDGQSVTSIAGATANSTVTLYAQWNHIIDLSTLTSDYTAINGDILTGRLGSNVKISIADGTIVTLQNATIDGVNNSSYKWAGINCLGNATIILEGNNSVKGFYESYSGIHVPQGKTLTIKGSGTLNASAHSKGCGISVAGSIIIESGIITATGGLLASGIGSPYYTSYGESNIIIRGGTVTATGGSSGAGIGTGASSTCGNITISGGTVTATGVGYAAGIGTGDQGTCNSITISGGTVTATGGPYAAGIGSGYHGNCGGVSITTGVTSVKATKGEYSPNSIGAGSDGTCGTVSIGGLETGSIVQSPVTYKPSENFKYTVAFNSNGGSGSMDNQQFLYGFAQNIRANTFTCTGHRFLGWSTTADGEVAYTDGQSVTTVANATANSTVTLYAQWSSAIDLSLLTGNYTAQDGDVLTGTLAGNYKISIADGATVTLRNATINGVNNNSYDWAGITCLGDATIVLESGTTNTVKGFYKIRAGIYIPTNKTLTIKGSGSLTARSNGSAAGIGGSNVANGDCGNIVIEDGTITATGGNSAGIGGCGNESCGFITISGGTVNATGGSKSPGIGAGFEGSCGNISISGGIVNAIGDTDTPGIGSGYAGTCSNIIISGGTVESVGIGYGPGIGAGRNGNCGNITISGGTINAFGGDIATGIGSGYQGTCGSITITTGVTSVKAVKGGTALVGHVSNSIGAGLEGTCGTVTIGGVETGNISQSPFITYPYTVAFNANGGTGTIEDMNFMYNVPQNLSDNTFTHTNGAYMGWNTQADGSGTAFADGQNVSTLASTSGATVTLYAQWQGGELVDGTPYKVTQDGSVTTATYTRPLTGRVGKHQAWFVPFDYEITSDDEGKFSFYKINMIANSPTPSQGATDEMWVFLKPIGAGTVLHANMPYVFKPKEDMESYSFTTANTTLKAKDTEVLAKMETMEDIYEVYGIYQNTSPSASDPFYYVNYYGEISLGNSSSVTVGPYRWIIRKTSKFGGTTSYAREMHFFDGEEDDATGLNEELRMKNEESSEDWYTLDGVKLSGKPTQKGIYIHGGRKEAIR